MLRIQADGSKMLDHDFLLNVLHELYDEILEFKQYLRYYYVENEANIIGSYLT